MTYDKPKQSDLAKNQYKTSTIKFPILGDVTSCHAIPFPLQEPQACASCEQSHGGNATLQLLRTLQIEPLQAAGPCQRYSQVPVNTVGLGYLFLLKAKKTNKQTNTRLDL